MKGRLFLVPNTLGEGSHRQVIPEGILPMVARLQHFIVENTRTARRYLKKVIPELDIDSLTFYEIDKHQDESGMTHFLAPIDEGKDMGLISEAGVPAVADPGSQFVLMAHRKGARVVPLTGPSSILMALMASGLNGQSFSFTGYLPVKKPERIRALRDLETRSKKENQTQIFMETPYRNMAMLEDILSACSGHTLLTVAADISLPGEMIRTRTVSEWKGMIPDIHKRPAIFLLYSP